LFFSHMLYSIHFACCLCIFQETVTASMVTIQKRTACSQITSRTAMGMGSGSLRMMNVNVTRATRLIIGPVKRLFAMYATRRMDT
jgi:hypothetical protein